MPKRVRSVLSRKRLAKESEKLEKICMSQQELLEEFRTIFSDLPKEP